MVGLAFEYTPDEFGFIPGITVFLGRSDRTGRICGFRVDFSWLFFHLYADLAWDEDFMDNYEDDTDDR